MRIHLVLLFGLSLCVPLCNAASIAFPQGYVPFSSINSISGPDANGFSLVEGAPTIADLGIGVVYQYLQTLPSVMTPELFSNQPVELAPNQFFANVLVPTDTERQGDFQDFGGTLLDPLSNSPFAANIIPTSRLFDVFAFRVEAAAPVVATPEPGYLPLIVLTLCLIAAIHFRRSDAKILS